MLPIDASILYTMCFGLSRPSMEQAPAEQIASAIIPKYGDGVSSSYLSFPRSFSRMFV